MLALPKHHILNSLLNEQHYKKAIPYHIATCHLTTKQHLKIKSPIVDINNHLNEVFLAFDSLNKEFSPSFHLVDNFSHCFSFHSVNWKDTDAKAIYQNKLNNIYENSSTNQNAISIISNVSVKNNITTLVSYIQRDHEIVTKTIHYAMNISSTEAKLFVIRCDISQATQIQDITHIVVIINAILATKQIFDLLIHPYQLYTIVISSNLRKFFNKNNNNLISFWDCPRSNKWPLHLFVNKESKYHKMNPILSSGTS